MGSWTVNIRGEMRWKRADRHPDPEHFLHRGFHEIITIISSQPNIQSKPRHAHTWTSTLLVNDGMCGRGHWGLVGEQTIIQPSARSFPCRGWSQSAAGCWCLAHWHRPDRVGRKPMEDNNSIGVWQIGAKSNSPDFRFDSDRLMSWSWMPLSPPRAMEMDFFLHP